MPVLAVRQSFQMIFFNQVHHVKTKKFRQQPILAIPGSIRKADNFCGWLRRLLEYFSSRLRVQQTVQESPLSFLKDLQNKILIDVRSLRLASERFQNLINTLQLIDLQVFTHRFSRQLSSRIDCNNFYLGYAGFE